MLEAFQMLKHPGRTPETRNSVGSEGKTPPERSPEYGDFSCLLLRTLLQLDGLAVVIVLIRYILAKPFSPSLLSC